MPFSRALRTASPEGMRKRPLNRQPARSSPPCTWSAAPTPEAWSASECRPHPRNTPHRIRGVPRAAPRRRRRIFLTRSLTHAPSAAPADLFRRAAVRGRPRGRQPRGRGRDRRAAGAFRADGRGRHSRWQRVPRDARPGACDLALQKPGGWCELPHRGRGQHARRPARFTLRRVRRGRRPAPKPVPVPVPTPVPTPSPTPPAEAAILSVTCLLDPPVVGIATRVSIATANMASAEWVRGAERGRLPLARGSGCR
jgi:hypothetical protein